jgi:glutathione synthase/RimK-type ligase-like ATP-grasp enzyme
MEKVPGNLKSFYKQAEIREEMLPLAGFDVIFMRANPPLDPIMLNFLDSVKDGLYFVGIDVIGGKLVEVNVMSPGGITYMNKVYKTKIQTKVIDFVESKVVDKLQAFNRRSRLRNEVENA